MRKVIILLILLAPTIALAAAGDDHHGVPWKFVIYQIINFVLVCALLVYFLKTKLRQHFSEREKSYNDLITKAERAKQAADESKKEIAGKLSKLESTAQESVERAKQDAEELKRKILDDARELAQNLELEAKRNVEHELEKAKQALRNDLLQNALEESRKALESKLNGNEQRRLKDEFVEKIQVVR